MSASLQEATAAALRAYPPFDQMGSKSLAFLAERLQLAYYARGATIVAPEAGVVQRLHILKQGRVRGGAGGSMPGMVDVVLGPGECFPLGALSGGRATIYTYKADEDCFCWELPAEEFRKLLERSARFRAFCTSHLAALVAQSHRALRADASDNVAGGMLRPLREVVSRAPVSCAPQTPVREVLQQMHDLRIGSMVIAEAGVPKGIFTHLDVLNRVALPQADVAAPISSVMSPDLVAMEEEEPVVDAALAMVRNGIRHVVVTRDGRLAGVISERDLFGMQRTSLRRIVERVSTAAGVPQLAEAAADVRALGAALLAQGVAAEQLTQMTSALNDSITQRVIELVAPRHALEGPWCWLALGSEGRLEQTLATDQDNALIFTAAGAGTKAARGRFLAFAAEVNLALDACGFPLCKGEIMARNPKWCLTAEEWRVLFAGWMRVPQPEALLNACIFFDFRALAGDMQLAGNLREHVLGAAAAPEHAAFRYCMAKNALLARPPLGLLRDFSTEESGEFAGTLNLKTYGARPLVDGARLLALAHGLPATSTAVRLRAAAAAGHLPQAEASALVGAFQFIQTLRLRRQYVEAGVAAGSENRIDPALLNDIDRRILKAAFRQANVLQERIKQDYAL
jgi:CBS domain-containing protein